MDPFEGFGKPKKKRKKQTNKYVQLDAHFGQIDFVYFSCFFYVPVSPRQTGKKLQAIFVHETLFRSSPHTILFAPQHPITEMSIDLLGLLNTVNGATIFSKSPHA